MSAFVDRDDGSARALYLAREEAPEAWALALAPAERTAALAWAAAQAFRGERGRALALPGADGALRAAVLGVGRDAPAEPGHAQLLPAADRLPPGTYRLEAPCSPAAATAAAAAFGIGRYRFERYRAAPLGPPPARLVMPAAADAAEVRRLVAADALARDLVNTPAEDLGPAELAAAVVRLAATHGAEVREVVGEALPGAGFPAIHAVGRAAARAPRLVELRHGESGPRVTLVGKGVCFDTGGLDLKPSGAMGLMKKDMGGAAMAIATASLVLEAGLPLRLRLIVPAVENSVAGNAYRPGDVLRTRKGLTVEVTNTDAEGRLVLADALALAAEERPDLLIDFATLTGAARVALGPELPAAYSASEALLGELAAAARATTDPVWPMPLWAGYEDELGSKVADLVNASSSPFAGSVTAALFLRRFVDDPARWLHLDLYAWNGKERPGRPVGAEAQTVRAVYRLLATRAAAGA